MQIYRATLHPASLQLTPWQADTLFGSLCWAYRFRHGEEKLRTFLQPFLDCDPPFLLSDGIPEGYLPLPFHLRLLQAAVEDAEAYIRHKALKKVRYLPEAEFFQACRDESVELDEEQAKKAANVIRLETQLHASINRITGTTTAGDEETGSGASLFQLNGWVPGGESQRFSLFIADRSGEALPMVMPLLRDMEITGFGKKKSSGMGAFKIEGEPEPWNPPSPGDQANGFVSLSGFVPKRSDPTAGFWQLIVKHGKLGEEYAKGGQPFKKPWIVLEAGSSFLTGAAPGETYGRMLENLTDRYPGVVQYGFAFPMPVVIPPNHSRLIQ